MSQPPQTDVSRPAALARATLQTSSRLQQQALLEQPSDEYLDGIEEEWNRRLDIEVETLVEGMSDLVAIASIGDKDKFRVAHESFQAQCRAESMVRAANSLLSLTHSLKLLLLLADESQIVRQRTAELSRVRTEVDAQRAKATELCDGLLHDEVLEGPVQAVAADSGA
ncbi:hypothetical protein EXIGLDRAFT_601213 [Exidia glandulosa HHB12029]|uniref:Mediator of RNA polymerase II transcription subunit 22 n=1 Tax=Exidia glandulosa HHB12029 TaxID=1314781 RepID=A0A165PXH5_EXIGL|nr:hypothetical protein EXIGLDRAFT_601213 [Exidia glandulosa HHB12029]